jgi:hypothetical protein
MGRQPVENCCQPVSLRRLKDESLICKQVVAHLLVLVCLMLLPVPGLAQALPTLGPTPGPTSESTVALSEAGPPGSQPPAPAGEQPGERLFQSPLATPAGSLATAVAPTPPPTDMPIATSSPTPTDTPVPTATATETPSATPSATVAPLQVSPLVAQSETRLPDDRALLWIGAAALVILAGSAVLVVAERRQNH